MKLFNSLLLASAMMASAAMAQDDEDLKPVVDEAAKINESAAQSQEKINKITNQIDSKLQQFKPYIIILLQLRQRDLHYLDILAVMYEDIGTGNPIFYSLK